MSINEGFLIKTSTSTSASSPSSKTPYQIAVENGYEGTEAEFNNALTKIDQVIYYEEKGNPEGVASLGDDGKVPYFQLPDFIKTEDKGKVGGVASLGDDGKVPVSQLPDSIGGGGVGKQYIGIAKIPDSSEPDGKYDKEIDESFHAEIFNDYRTPAYEPLAEAENASWLSAGNIAGGDYSTAIGSLNIVTSGSSLIGGKGNRDFGFQNGCNLTLGSVCRNAGGYNVLFGLQSIITGSSDSDALCNIVSGFTHRVSGSYNAVFGLNNKASGSSATVSGSNNIAQGRSDVVLGQSNTTKAQTLDSEHNYSTCNIVIGNNNKAEGYNNALIGLGNSCVDGITNKSENNVMIGSSNGNSVLQASSTTTDYSCSRCFVTGNYNNIGADDSYLLGTNCLVLGSNNFAVGTLTFINGGAYNIAMGYQANIGKDAPQNCVAIGKDAQITTNDGYIMSGYSMGEGTKVNTHNAMAIGRYNTLMTRASSSSSNTGPGFVVGNGSTNSSRSNAFRVNFNGAVYGLSAFNSSGADYAEYFEWLDGNPDNQDRVGYFVAMVDDKIVFANPGDFILGVVSGQPCIIGNSDEDWLGRWEHDEFDRFIKEYLEDTEVEIEVPEDEEEKMKLLSQSNYIQKDGKFYRIDTTVVDYETPSWRYKENPNYNPEQQYIERKDRKEWSAIGMMGVLAVRDDGSCSVNGYCKVDNGGTATSANEYIPGQTWRVIKRVSENVIKIIFK